MTVERLKKWFELDLKYLSKTASQKKIDKSIISQAESYLDVIFPPTYRYYLEHIHPNTLVENILGLNLTGENRLDNKSPLIEITLQYRQEKLYPLPKKYVVVEIDMPDFDHILDTCDINLNGESPVIGWHGSDYYVKYPDFDLIYAEVLTCDILSSFRESPNKKTILSFLDDYKNCGFTFEEVLNVKIPEAFYDLLG